MNDYYIQCILTYMNPFGKEKKIVGMLHEVLMRHEYH